MNPPFAPGQIAALARLSVQINGRHAPEPIAGGVEIVDGRVRLPVPDYGKGDLGFIASLLREPRYIRAQLHAGLTLQWAPLPQGAMVEFRGGPPDGDASRDACACFLTPSGLRGLAADLVLIADALSSKGEES